MPSGASTGIHEALELRDKGKDYHGKSLFLMKMISAVMLITMSLIMQ